LTYGLLMIIHGSTCIMSRPYVNTNRRRLAGGYELYTVLEISSGVHSFTAGSKPTSFTNHHGLPSSLRTDSTDLTTLPFLLSISVFVCSFLHYSFSFFGSVRQIKLPTRQLLGARKNRVVSYRCRIVQQLYVELPTSSRIRDTAYCACADVMGWPQSYCKYPAWLSRTVWVELDGQNVFTVDNASHVIRAGVRPEVTSRPAVLKSLRCLRVVEDRKSRSSSVFVALAFVSHVWSVLHCTVRL